MSQYLVGDWVPFAKYLLAHGYTPVATAAIVGSSWGESHINVESVGSGGGGLIGFTPLPHGYVTGNRKKDQQTQFRAVDAYIQKNGSKQDMNRFHNIDEALNHFVYHYERPAAPGPDAAIRRPAARALFAAIKAKNWKSSGGGGGGGSATAPALGLDSGLSSAPLPIPGLGFLGSVLPNITGAGKTIGDIGTSLSGVSKDIETMIHLASALFQPQLWLRVGAFVVGVIVLAAGMYMIGKAFDIQMPGGMGAGGGGGGKSGGAKPAPKPMPIAE